MTASLVFKILWSVVGGLGIFLLGMKHMSEGMQAVAGNKLRALINAVTNNRFIACVVGVIVTAIIQSSSVTTVMVVGFVNASIMNLTQAIGVILGADIGTTITGWILVLPIAKFGLPILGIAALFYLFSNKDRLRYTAMTIMGLGMIFFGLQLMKNGFKPLKDMPEFIEWFSRFTPTSYLGVLKCTLVGAMVTAIVQSSSATVGITMGLASTGVINFETAAALVLGENIGTTVTAYLASLGASTNAKRAAYAHILIKVIGVAWITAIFPYYITFIKKLVSVDPNGTMIVDGVKNYPHMIKSIAMTHTVFNVINVVLFLPLITPFSKLLIKIAPDKPVKEPPKLTYLDVRMLDTPALGIAQSKKEVLNMSKMVKEMMDDLNMVLSSDQPDEEVINRIFRKEEVLDIIQKEIVVFLSNLLGGSVPHEVMDQARSQLRMADEYETLSDYIVNVLKMDRKLRKNNHKLHAEGYKERLDLHNNVCEFLKTISTAVEEENPIVLSKAYSEGERITRLMKSYRRQHLTRLAEEKVTPLTSLIYTDMLNAYRRMKDHALNIAEALAGEK